MADTRPIPLDNALIAQLIEAIPTPIYYKDAKGRYLGCNAAFEAYVGRSREALLGKTAYDIWPKDLADSYSASDIDVLKMPGPQVQTGEVVYADGTRHQVIVHRAAFLGEDGSPAGIVGVGWDITDRSNGAPGTRRFIERMGQFLSLVGLAALDSRMLIVTDIERLMTSADMELVDSAAA